MIARDLGGEGGHNCTPQDNYPLVSKGHIEACIEHNLVRRLGGSTPHDKLTSLVHIVYAKYYTASDHVDKP